MHIETIVNSNFTRGADPGESVWVSGAARGGKLRPIRVDVQKLWNRPMCVLSLSWNFFVSLRTKPYKFPMHCSKCVSFWETSYSRLPIDPYLTSPCYKILAAPLVWVYRLPESWRFCIADYGQTCRRPSSTKPEIQGGPKTGPQTHTIIISNLNRFIIFSLKNSLVNLQLNGY